MAKIYCSVSNCHYYAQGNVCNANEIMVTNDRMGNQMPDNMDAPQATQFTPSPAQTCMETCCKTFVQKGGQTGMDGVYQNSQMQQQYNNRQ